MTSVPEGAVPGCIVPEALAKVAAPNVAGGGTAPGTPMKPTFGPTALLTPANTLTFVRMALTPVMIAVMWRLRYDGATFWLWSALCGTDGVDGILARRYGVTRSGAFLDPLADKFLVLGGMFTLAAKQVFLWPLVVVIAVREVGMSLYRSIVSTRGISIPARKSAKVKTFIQQISVGFAIMPWIGHHASWVGKSLLIAAVVLTVWTGGQYLVDARRPDLRGPAPTG